MKLIYSAKKKNLDFEVFLNKDGSLVGKIDGSDYKVTNSKVQGKYCFRFYDVKKLVGVEVANIISETAKEMFLNKQKVINKAFYESGKEKRAYLGIGE